MQIRNATFRDAPAIKLLLEASGHKASTSLLVNQLETLFGGNDHQVFIYEQHKELLGFISVHYLPILASRGETAFISYLLVDESVKDQRIDKALEQYVTHEALKRKCDRIQVHSMDCLTPPHEFYSAQGYQETAQYFTKKLDQQTK
jgi:predicted N-acetyltransferase YhbS